MRSTAAGLTTALICGSLLACGSLGPSERDLTIPIRNEWDRPAILEVIEAPDDVEGRVAAVFGPAITVEPGEELTTRLRAPVDRWALRLSNGDRGFLHSGDLLRASRDDVAVYVRIDHRGSLSLFVDP